MRPTETYTPAEQFEAGIAAGITPGDMLRNVDAAIDRVASDIARECRRAPDPAYAARIIRERAETAIHLRALRAFIVAKLLSCDHA